MGKSNMTLECRRRNLRRLVECVDLSMAEAGPLIDRLVGVLLSERHPDLQQMLTSRNLPPTWEGVTAAAADLAGEPDGVATAQALDDLLLTATIVAVALRW
jgi:hypothetical protein